MERSGDQQDLPITIDADAAKGVGMTIKEYGTVVLPAKSLTAEALAKAGADVLPVGFMWLKSLVPRAEGGSLKAEKRREVKVVVEKEEYNLQLLELGLRKKGDSAFELVVFTRGKDAVLTLPLKEETREQQMPVELDMRQGSESLGLIDIRILGHLQATLPVDGA
jgi:hypothetical protein